MLSPALTNPTSICVVGGSESIAKPGGRLLYHLRRSFAGPIAVVNPREAVVQTLPTVADVALLEGCYDLAFLAVPAAQCPAIVERLIAANGTRAFVVISAGFGEESEQGAILEKTIAEAVGSIGGTLIGPNCIGLATAAYTGVFTQPTPPFNPAGCDFVTASGATAVMTMEVAAAYGVPFANIYSVGNGTHTGVEQILAHLDEEYRAGSSAPVKLLYLESIRQPDLLLRHARSLVAKGAAVVAIKAGRSVAGARAASSHTGALASSDRAVEALFARAGIVRCVSRHELVTTAAALLCSFGAHGRLRGIRHPAVITHAGGPGVLLTDSLAAAGVELPAIEGAAATALKSRLYPGAAVGNPIDILATGTAAQLADCLRCCDQEFAHLDAAIVIFGSPGLFPVDEVYKVIAAHRDSSPRPLFAVLPSVANAKREREAFLQTGGICFEDETALGRAIGAVNAAVAATERVRRTSAATEPPEGAPGAAPFVPRNPPSIDPRRDLNAAGYATPATVAKLLDHFGVARPWEITCAVPTTVAEFDRLVVAVEERGFPVVAKVVGPLHKSDLGGVIVGIRDRQALVAAIERIAAIPGCTGVLLQQQCAGIECLVGVGYEPGFGHLIAVGFGGVFVEVWQDVRFLLAPVTALEAREAISSLRGYPILAGARGAAAADVQALANVVEAVGRLVSAYPALREMDCNPVLVGPVGASFGAIAVDARIRFEIEME